jgi:predicted lipoprotein with Yx(FWY)xxD motif
MSRISLAAAVAVTAALAGCGGGGSGRAATPASAPTSQPNAAPASATASTPTRAPAARGTLVKVRRSEFGRVLVDRRGQALYLFTKDRGGPSRCFGQCATAWPPLYTGGPPVAGAGADAAKLGTVRRGSRLQVTYAGQPLYLYQGDTPTQILCQSAREFGGLWLVVKPSGAPVT